MPPATKILIPFVIGVFWGDRLSPSLTITVLLLILSVASVPLSYIRFRRCFDFVSLLTFLILGSALIVISSDRLDLTGLSGRDVVFQGEVADVMNGDHGMILRCSGRLIGGSRCRLEVRSSWRTHLERGDRIRAVGKLVEIGKPANPGQFNRARYLASKGIIGELRARAIWRVPSSRVSFRRFAGRIRGRIDTLMRRLLPENQHRIIMGIFMGERDLLDETSVERFRRSGLAHLLAVSGLHVGMVSSFCFLILRTIGLSRRLTALTTIALVMIYCLMVGLRESVARTAVMVTLILIGQVIDRDIDLMNLLSIAALIILVYSPFSLWSVGFQLTFLVTASIVHVVQRWNRFSHKHGFFRSAVLFPLVISLSAMAASIPITSYYFRQIHPWAILANLVAVWMLWAAVGLAILCMIVGLIWLPLAYPFAALLSVDLGVFDHLTRLLVSLPLSTIAMPRPRLGHLCAYLFIGVSLVNIRWIRENPGKWILAGMILITSCVWYYAITWHGDISEVTFLSVGYGTAVVVKTGEGKTALINAGPKRGEFDAGESIVGAFLHQRRVSFIDLVTATDDSPSSIGGMPGIASNFVIGDSALGRTGLTSAKLDERCLVDAQVVSYEPFVQLVRVAIGDLRVLLADSMTAEMQRELGTTNADLRADLLGVPKRGNPKHHLPEFLDRVDPRLAIISVGNNPFGFPDDELIRSYEKRGIKVLRTDRSGAISVLTDGKRCWVKEYRQDDRNRMSF